MMPLAFSLIGLCAADARPAPDPAALAVPPAAAARSRELVRQLSSEAYADRDKATRELRAMGRLALPALAAGRADADLEARGRCATLAVTAEDDDVKARVAVFLADAGGRYDHGLPGWAAFRAAAGDDPAARALYADILATRAARPLLAAADGPPPGLARELGRYRGWLKGREAGAGPAAPLTPAEVAAFLFADPLAARPAAPAGPPTFQPSIYLVRHGRGLLPAAGPAADAARRLLVQWLDGLPQPASAYTVMTVAEATLEPPDAARYAARAVGMADAPGYVRTHGLTTLGRLRAADHLDAVAGLFADDRPAGQVKIGTAVVPYQFRDAALVTAVVVTGQEPATYGFRKAAFVGNVPFVAGFYAFATDAAGTAEHKRAAAFEKWRAWEAARAKPPGR